MEMAETWRGRPARRSRCGEGGNIRKPIFLPNPSFCLPERGEASSPVPSQSVAVIKSLKRRDHPPSQHLPGMKPLKGWVKEGRKISDKQPFSEIISDYFFAQTLSKWGKPIASPCPLARHSGCRDGGSMKVRVSQTKSTRRCWPNRPENLCKCRKINDLHNKQSLVRSKSIKVNQTDILCGLAVLFLRIAHFWQNFPNRLSE
jgi:hypothetical protein